MTLIATEGGNGDFEIAPEGSHLARCFKVIDMGTQYSEMYEKYTPKVMICWEFPNTKMDDGQPFSTSKWYTVSLHEKANLTHDLEAWRGKTFTEEEKGGFDLKNLLGVPCFIGIAHEEKNGKTRDVITSIMKLPEGTECPMGINESVYFTLDPFDQTIFDSLSDGLKDIIKKSTEWEELQKAVDKGVVEVLKEASKEDDVPF